VASGVPVGILNLRADTSRTGARFCRALAEANDAWLAGLFTAALDGAEPRGLALVAVGGYGRGELCPGSDIDVLLLDGRGGTRRDGRSLKELAERVWYPVWDAGVKLGHAVRTPKEALALAADDLDTATALLDVRLVAGDEAVAANLADRAIAQWRARASRWLAALAASVAERHRRAGEVAFRLEPDLKEGRGGLRDVHALRWAESAQRILLEEDRPAIDDAYETILAARVELQRPTGRALEILVLQEQDRVAAALGYGDPPGGADALMAKVSAAARTIAWTSDETWQRIEASLKGPRGRVATRDHPLGRGLVLREGLVEMGPDADSGRDAALALRAAALAASRETRIGRATLSRLAAEAVPPPEPWPEDARRELLRLLGAGRAAIPVVEALDQAGILVRLIPEWEPVRSLPQRNAYHRFTVDRHLTEAAAEAAALAARVHRPDLLLFGAWLHDIGKGYPGGHHSDTGAEVVERVATRLGFPPEDVAVLATLARLHLLLPDVATRRDVQDPATVEAVATAVGDTGTLELLHALTEADSIATGPAAWSPWKAGLVAELVTRTAAMLGGNGHAAPESDFPNAAHRALIERANAGSDVVLDGHGREMALAVADRPGLFSRVAGILALNGLDVLSARVWTSDDGVAVEEFLVDPVFGGDPDWGAIEEDVRRVLAGRLSLEARLAERARVYGGRSSLPSATPARTQVLFDNDASPGATVVEVRAPDRIGTLYRITRALADLELDIRSAKVATLGHEVVDAFYVLDGEGEKLTDADHRREVEGAVLLELSRA
jgi:[protein-PII] uridylyltransferase